jgi:hypothetical protein
MAPNLWSLRFKSGSTTERIRARAALALEPQSVRRSRPARRAFALAGAKRTRRRQTCGRTNPGHGGDTPWRPRIRQMRLGLPPPLVASGAYAKRRPPPARHRRSGRSPCAISNRERVRGAGLDARGVPTGASRANHRRRDHEVNRAPAHATRCARRVVHLPRFPRVAGRVTRWFEMPIRRRMRGWPMGLDIVAPLLLGA